MHRLARRSRLLTAALVAAPVFGVLAADLPGLLAAPSDSVSLQISGSSVGSDAEVSGDGRRVVYVARSTVMGAESATSLDSVWLLERASGERRELTTPIDGTRPGSSTHPILSDDGCTVVVVTQLAYDLFRDDDHGDRWDVYRTVLPGRAGAFAPGEWELVSSTAGPDHVSATDAVDPTDRPAVSASGQFVAYTSAVNPESGARLAWTGIMVADLAVPLGESGRVLPVPALPITGPVVAGTFVGQREPVLSSDGRYLAYVTDALPAVSEDPSGALVVTGTWTDQVVEGRAVTQVVRWDRTPSDDEDGAWFRILSTNPEGLPGNGSSRAPSLNRYGDIAVFSSVATDLAVPPVAPAEVPAEVPEPVATAPVVEQIYRVAVGTGAAHLVSQAGGVPGDAASTAPVLDDSGRLVAFQTRASNLLAPPPARSADPAGTDLLLADVESGTFRRLTTRPDGQPASFAARRPSISGTARVVAFETAAAAELGLPTSGEEPGVDPETGAPLIVWEVVVAEFPAELSSADLDLGTTEVGAPSAEWYSTIVNDGDGAFVPEVISTSNPEFSVSGGTCRAGVPLLPGESCTVEVTFTPSIAGPASTEIVVAERGPGAVAVDVAVTATAGTPSLEASPSAIQLGEALVGLRSEPASLAFTNVGATATSISELRFGGSHPDDFVVVVDRCRGATLGAGDSCEIAVSLAPAESGARSATVTAVAANGATASAVVVGTGRYTPVAGIEQTSVTGGGRVDLVGLGFPAASFVSVGWEGTDDTVLVLTDGRGELSTRIVAPKSLGAGRRALVLLDPLNRHDPVRTAEVLVTNSQQSGATSPAHRPR